MYSRKNSFDLLNKLLLFDLKENKASMLRILGLNKPEWPYVLLGSLASFAMGCTAPVCAIFFGELYGVSYVKNYIYSMIKN